MTTRRTFLRTLAGGFLAAPHAADAQPTANKYRLGLLGGSPPNSPGGRRAWEGFFHRISCACGSPSPHRQFLCRGRGREQGRHESLTIALAQGRASGFDRGLLGRLRPEISRSYDSRGRVYGN